MLFSSRTSQKPATLWVCAFTLVAAFSVQADPSWNANNDPAIFDSNYVRAFDRLPLSAQLPDDKTPWADDYWAYNEGGLNRRWFATYKDEKIQGFGYKPPTRAQALAMTPMQLKRLSPAEKYDLFLGHYDYPTVKWVWKNVSKSDETWKGICNGWAPASILYTEPSPVILRNPDGIEVPFGSSDVKALISLFYSWGTKIQTRQLGRRCNFELKGALGGLFTGYANCKDTDAGAFHIVLTNQIALKHESFIADVDRGKEVWNNPIYKYEGKVMTVARPDSDSPKGTVQRMRVLMTVWITEEIDPQWEPVNGTDNFLATEIKYDYWLDLDYMGNIIGGKWMSYERPDFLWVTTKIPFSGTFEPLNRIYTPYIKSVEAVVEPEATTPTSVEGSADVTPVSESSNGASGVHPSTTAGPTFE